MQRLWDDELVDPYGVDEVAWEHTAERSQEIFRGTTARLMIAWHGCVQNGQRQTKGMWFWTAQSDSYAPGGHAAGWRLRPVDRSLRFDLTVMNVSDETEIKETFVLEFDDDGTLQGFHQLTDAL